jgi:alpha-ribazole phosphatase
MIYLIRHTTPDINTGVCYGQSDLDITSSFQDEAIIIRHHLPPDIEQVYSSPLQRCRKLASWLYPDHDLLLDNDLKELHCGDWELKNWNDIAKEELDPWMKDFVNYCVPGGESYTQLYERTVNCFANIIKQKKSTAVFTHGGVIRSILSLLAQTPLIDSFSVFKLHYGCVIKIAAVNNGYQYEILSNIPSIVEQHRPA